MLDVESDVVGSIELENNEGNGMLLPLPASKVEEVATGGGEVEPVSNMGNALSRDWINGLAGILSGIKRLGRTSMRLVLFSLSADLNQARDLFVVMQ